jgi:hypothetical protein
VDEGSTHNRTPFHLLRDGHVQPRAPERNRRNGLLSFDSLCPSPLTKLTKLFRQRRQRRISMSGAAKDAYP